MTGGSKAPVAVIDIGSGSVKLLVTRLDDSGETQTLAAESVTTRLLASLERGRVEPEALVVTDTALARFAATIDALVLDHGPIRVAAVATAVARAMTDPAPLAEMVEARLGVALDVLSEAREAELAFAGSQLGNGPGPDEAVGDPVVMIDLGAGSTEIAVGQPGARPTTCSLPVGASQLTDQYLHGDPPRPEELSSALSVVELYLEDVRRELPQVVAGIDAGAVVGVGAIITIAAVEIGHVDADVGVHGHVLTKPAVEELFRALATEPAEDRAHNPGLPADHVDDIVGAMCVLVEFMRQFGVDEMVVGERGLRHGLSAEMLTDC